MIPSDAYHVDQFVLEPSVERQRAALRFDQTISRALVHKESVAEVFLTDALPAGGDRVLVAAQWPRAHAFYRPDVTGCTDPMLLIETVRQAAIYVAHSHHGVPGTWPFIFSGLELSLEEHELTRSAGVPVQAVLDCTYTASDQRGKSRGRLDCVIEVDGRVVGRATAKLLAVEAPLYRKLRHRGAGSTEPRAPRPAALLTGDQVGRHNPADILVGSADGELVLRVDPSHPAYFEHACDHLPGMVLIEAFRQAGYFLRHDPNRRLVGTPLPVWLSRLSVDFGSFGELGDEVVLRAHRKASATAAGSRIELEAVQGGKALATASAEFVTAFFH